MIGILLDIALALFLVEDSTQWIPMPIFFLAPIQKEEDVNLFRKLWEKMFPISSKQYLLASDLPHGWANYWSVSPSLGPALRRLVWGQSASHLELQVPMASPESYGEGNARMEAEWKSVSCIPKEKVDHKPTTIFYGCKTQQQVWFCVLWPSKLTGRPNPSLTCCSSRGEQRFFLALKKNFLTLLYS